MGRPQADERLCRWHPKYKLSSGVCPFCVREKLLQLTTSPFSACSSYSAYVYSSTASSSRCSLGSDVSSSASSPRRRQRYVDHVKRARATHLVKGEALESANKLKKSRSLVFEIGAGNELEMEEGKHKNKGKEKEEEEKKKRSKTRRFWSKLLLSGARRRDREEVAAGGGLRYSQTFKEKAHTTWALLS